ncbi:FMN-binding domain-containing protein [[Clostridium] sordellii]|uniref:FMN-binding protein n=1 Tax=Paraclostridium sordellii TaxID=1505 RepID=UPI0005E1C7CD|nr:FMN-binding protein [Paeniclostridium sordellii]CEQ29799.1 FMN-binding domain-containing protein [[Clostridium] sordellii] [Paeniclostridium sordellii]
MNKKLIFSIGIISLGVALSGCSEKNVSVKESKNEKASIDDNLVAFKDGIFEGEGEGFNGKIKVSLEVKNGRIEKIDILNSGDDDEYLNEAKKLIPTIIKKQSSKVDSVSGATYSSKGIISAVENALKNAK